MTLEKCKDKIAQDEGYHDWEDLHKDLIGYDLSDYWLDIAKLYAQEKVKEALKLAAERAEVIFHDGTTKKETNHGRVNIGNNHIRPDLALTLSLETELLTKIEKE